MKIWPAVTIRVSTKYTDSTLARSFLDNPCLTFDFKIYVSLNFHRKLRICGIKKINKMSRGCLPFKFKFCSISVHFDSDTVFDSTLDALLLHDTN